LIEGSQVSKRFVGAARGHCVASLSCVAPRAVCVVAASVAIVGAGPMTKAEPLPTIQSAMHDTRNSGVAIGLARSRIIDAESGDGPAEKGGYRVGSLVVTEPWSRPTPGGARLTAGYLRIVNTGTEPDRLIGGSARIADQLELHSSETDNGISRMRPLRDGIEIPAGETIELRPGGKHLMFAHLRNSVAQGERFEATLVFEKAGPLVVEFDVRNHAGDAETEP